MNDEILYDVADGVGTVTLNRPQARNALTFAMYEGLAEILGNPEKHGAPKVFVVTGADHNDVEGCLHEKNCRSLLLALTSPEVPALPDPHGNDRAGTDISTLLLADAKPLEDMREQILRGALPRHLLERRARRLKVGQDELFGKRPTLCVDGIARS